MLKDTGKRKINGLDVYQIECPHCSVTFEGRFAYPSFVGADAHYCNKCPNIKIWSGSEEGPKGCECGGAFDAYNLLCPSCKNVIHDAEIQLATQFYVIEPCKTPGKPTQQEIDNWYTARKKENFLTGSELFIQLQKLLSLDEETNTWRYFDKFEK